MMLNQLPGVLRRVEKRVRKKGLRGFASRVFNVIRLYVRAAATYWVPYVVCLLSLMPLESFAFQGRRYRYFCHPTNMTWRSERCVEVAVAYPAVRRFSEADVLEVGNVLGLYFPTKHEVVDKYESAPGVYNVDVLDFRPSKKYGLIVSISTLEHVGWDEKPREPKKALDAIKHLTSLLKPDGMILVTLPMGWNYELDNFLRSGAIRFSHLYCLKRISSSKWKESDWNEIRNAKFGSPFPFANGLVVGIIRKDSEQSSCSLGQTDKVKIDRNS
jgi:hypothetical protein